MSARKKTIKKHALPVQKKLFSKKLAKALGLTSYGDAGFLVLVGIVLQK